jgi:hypothetical protein
LQRKSELEGVSKEGTVLETGQPDPIARREGARVMRTYGQRKSKPDAGDAEEPGLSAALLRIIAGKKD